MCEEQINVLTSWMLRSTAVILLLILIMLLILLLIIITLLHLQAIQIIAAEK